MIYVLKQDMRGKCIWDSALKGSKRAALGPMSTHEKPTLTNDNLLCTLVCSTIYHITVMAS